MLRNRGILLRTANTKSRNRGIATRLHTVYTTIGTRHGAKFEIDDIAIATFILLLLVIPIALQSQGLLNLFEMCLELIERLGTGPLGEVDRSTGGIGLGNM